MIVLAFVVLLTVLVVAYFSRTMTSRQLSNTSFNQAKAAQLAQSAADLVIGDLKQEIVAGSTPILVGVSPNQSNVYVPTVNANMLPMTSGTPATGATPIPNLVRRTIYPDTIVAPGIPSRASAVNSLADPSIGGRSISLTRWNSHYFVPRANTGTTIDDTPVTSFVAPDWVIVTRNGPKSFASWDGTVKDPSNANFAVGRYAYAIYDEGGLLDVNVAGYPSPTPAGTPVAAYKASTAVTDLTQIPPTPAPLAQSQINNIVGWRNYATAQPNGDFASNFTFDPTSTGRYLTAVLSNITGFRKAATTVWQQRTDQQFTSRQELLSFRKATGFTQNALQYLTTFSRSLDQPSFIPATNRPKVVGTSTPPGGGSATIPGYSGNNTYYGGEAAINMVGTGGFLSIRVKTAFQRTDGTTAILGEPLVKRKFALSRLAQVTTTATAANSDTDPIHAQFGIYRTTTSQGWTYSHGGDHILTLSEVRDLSPSREPDFAELLKAAINVGSVGKAGPSGQANNTYEYPIDVSGDVQILQIMANLIDQQKLDNYPTWIKYVQIFQGTSFTRNIYGAQDLPYFYRWHYYAVTTRVPSPLLAKTDVAPELNSSINHIRLGTLGDPGAASYLIIPEIWNPHDANTPPAVNGGPTLFRVTAETNDPTGLKGAWGIRAVPLNGGGSDHFDGAPFGYESADPSPITSVYSAAKYMIPSSSYMQFSDTSGGKAFREPTLLWRDGVPNGTTLAGTPISRKEDASLTGNTYYGILIGDTPISWNATVNGMSYVCQSSALQRAPSVPGGGSSETDNITFRMQYQNSAGTWVNYQEMYAEDTLTYIPTHTLFVNKADYSADNKYANPLMGGITNGGPNLTAPEGGPYDPRTGRFSAPVSGDYTKDDPTLNGNPSLDAITMVLNNNPSASQNLAVATSNFVLMKTQRPTASRGQLNFFLVPNNGPYNTTAGWYSSGNWKDIGKGPMDANFYDGLLSQNNPAVQLLGGDADGGTNAQIQQEYYEDPDGICRRAMGGYVPVSGTVIPGTNTGRLTNTTTTVGLPMATSAALNGDGTAQTLAPGQIKPSSQSQSRPVILHRPFRSVSEMSYAFRGTPWKQIDFFTPESGDTALLDVFSVNEVPSDALVAGKVNLNTRQAPVLQTLFAGAYRDEWASLATPPTSGTLPPLSATEAKNLADTFLGITTGIKSWEGPLTNIGDVVGHYVYPKPPSVSGADVYQYKNQSSGITHTYGGFSAALSGTTPSGGAIWDGSPATLSPASQYIQRFRESAIRPLADCGQTRVWNLLIDVVAQSGRYPSSASSLPQFFVEGEKHYWVHVAIDRYTGEVIDKQVEAVTE